jgi:hypothetical protein
MRRGGGYLFLPGFSSLYDAIHGWMMGRMTGRMDGWKKLHKKQPQRPLLYVICHYGPPNQIVILYGGEGGSLSHLASGS